MPDRENLFIAELSPGVACGTVHVRRRSDNSRVAVFVNSDWDQALDSANDFIDAVAEGRIILEKRPENRL
jgi:hypothetical protein